MTRRRKRRRPEPAGAKAGHADEGPPFADDGEHADANDRQSEGQMAEQDRTPDADAAPAVQDTERADAARPTDPRIQQAKSAADGGNVARAIELYRSVVSERPGDLEARLALGRIYDRRGEHHLALEHFEAARDAAPDDVGVLVDHANALAQLGRFDTAEKELRRALRIDPARPAVHASLGIINFRRGVYGQAEQELKRAIDLDPSAPAPFHYRGESLNQLNRVDEALTMLQRAAQLEPTHARTYYVMGIVFDKKGRPQEAAAMYRKAREVATA